MELVCHLVQKTNVVCTLNNEEYTYKVEYDEKDTIRMAGGSTYIADKIHTESYNKGEDLMNAIETYFKEQGGTCHFS